MTRSVTLPKRCPFGRMTLENSMKSIRRLYFYLVALILVGVPIFLVHWLWAQRVSSRDEEEKTASIRAVFLYAILLATLIPVVQNLLSFIDRSLIQVTGLGVERSFTAFRQQTIADNLIAILMNGIVAAYFWNVLRSEWVTLADKE